MSAIYLGTAPLKISSEVSFDPRHGYQTHEIYGGPQTTLATMNTTLQLLGVRTTISERAGKTYLDVFYALADPTGSETPTDFWDLETDFFQSAIWQNEMLPYWASRAYREGLLANRFSALISLGYWTQAEVAQVTVHDILAFWRRECEAALKGHTLNVGGEDRSVENPTSTDTANGLFARVNGPLDFNTSAVRQFDKYEKEIYRMLLREESAYENTRQVLTRSRTISIRYSARAVAEAQPYVYLTQELVNTFAIPAQVAIRLPADPSAEFTPKNHTWGWKQQRNNSRYEWSGRVVETMSWTFAAWSIMTHTFRNELIVQP